MHVVIHFRLHIFDIKVLPSSGFDRPVISLSTLSMLQVRKSETVDSIPDNWQSSFSSLPSPDIFGAYLACYPVGIWSSFPGIRRSDRDANHSPPKNKNDWRYQRTRKPGLIRYDIFVNCKWLVTRWQLYNTHLHTNNTQNDTKQIHRTKQNLRIQKFWNSAARAPTWRVIP